MRGSPDRATAAIWQCAARALCLPPPILRQLPRRVLGWMLHRARVRAERKWHRWSLRVDAIIGAQDALREGRLP